MSSGVPYSPQHSQLHPQTKAIAASIFHYIYVIVFLIIKKYFSKPYLFLTDGMAGLNSSPFLISTSLQCSLLGQRVLHQTLTMSLPTWLEVGWKISVSLRLGLMRHSMFRLSVLCLCYCYRKFSLGYWCPFSLSIRTNPCGTELSSHPQNWVSNRCTH